MSLRWHLLFKRQNLQYLLIQVLVMILFSGLFSFSADVRHLQFKEYVGGHPIEQVDQPSLTYHSQLEVLNDTLLIDEGRFLPSGVKDAIVSVQGKIYGYSPIGGADVRIWRTLSVQIDMDTVRLNLLPFSNFSSLDDSLDYYVVNQEQSYVKGANLSAPLVDTFENYFKDGVFLGDVIVNVDHHNNSIEYMFPEGASFSLDVSYKFIDMDPEALFDFLLHYEVVRKRHPREPKDYSNVLQHVEGGGYSYVYTLEDYMESFLKYESDNEIGMRYFFYAPIAALVILLHLLFRNYYRRVVSDKEFLDFSGFSTRRFHLISYLVHNYPLIIGGPFFIILGQVEVFLVVALTLALDLTPYLKSFSINLQDAMYLGVGILLAGGVLGVVLYTFTPLVFISLFVSTVVVVLGSLLFQWFFSGLTRFFVRRAGVRRNITAISFVSVVLLLVFSNLMFIYNFRVNDELRMNETIKEGSPCVPGAQCVDVQVFHTRYAKYDVDVLVTDLSKFIEIMKQLSVGVQDNVTQGDIVGRDLYSSIMWKLGIARPVEVEFRNQSKVIRLEPRGVIDDIPGYRGKNWIVIDKSKNVLGEPDEVFRLGEDRSLPLKHLASFFLVRSLSVFSIVLLCFLSVEGVLLVFIYRQEVSEFKRRMRRLEVSLKLFSADRRILVETNMQALVDLSIPIVCGSLLSLFLYSFKTFTGEMVFQEVKNLDLLLVLLFVQMIPWMIMIQGMFWLRRRGKGGEKVSTGQKEDTLPSGSVVREVGE